MLTSTLFPACLHQTPSSYHQTLTEDLIISIRHPNFEKMATSEEGQVIGCHSVDEWKAQFQKGVESKKLVVVDFTASWCGPCRFIAPILAEIAKKTTHVIFLKVDVDELKTVSEEFCVEAMPTFLFLREGKEVHRIVGARKEQLQAKITELGDATLTA